MTAPSIIVLVIDRLGAGWLGPYGNTWVDTPTFNRLASQSLVFDCAMADSPQLAGAYQAFWYGRHSLQANLPVNQRSLIDVAGRAGLTSLLITDAEEVSGFYAAGDFNETVTVPLTGNARAADDPSDTQLAHTLAMALEAIEQETGPSLFWIHAAGTGLAWDAPDSLREALVDEDDPEPPRIVAPPNMLLPESFDPDELTGIIQTYAGQVSLCDMLVDVLSQLVESRKDTLFAFTSPRGYPLGEHQRVGNCDNSLFGELLHVPLFLRFPDGMGAAMHSHTLVQPHDLFATLCAAVGGNIDSVLSAGSDLRPRATSAGASSLTRACASNADEFAIRTPAWFLRVSETDGAHLFAKPDDFWEANEVSDRCQDIVELLRHERDLFEEAMRSGTLSSLPELPDVLVRGLD